METDATLDARADISDQVHSDQNIKTLSKKSRFYCKVCNFQAQNQFEFKMHYSGMKHLKSMR